MLSTILAGGTARWMWETCDNGVQATLWQWSSQSTSTHEELDPAESDMAKVIVPM
jgi:hypothetical protein